MESKDTILGRIKNWALTLQQRLFWDDRSSHIDRQKQFRDSYQHMEDLHDQEMERLVKVIENTRDENSMRYH